jgi:hypothetical protein
MTAQKKTASNSRTLWIWVILAFVILISAWTTLIIIASKNQPELIEIQEP